MLGDSSPPAPMLNKPPPATAVPPGVVAPVGVPGNDDPNAGPPVVAPAPNPANGVELVAAPNWKGEPPGVVEPAAAAGAPKLKPEAAPLGVVVPNGDAVPPLLRLVKPGGPDRVSLGSNILRIICAISPRSRHCLCHSRCSERTTEYRCSRARRTEREPCTGSTRGSATSEWRGVAAVIRNSDLLLGNTEKHNTKRNSRRSKSRCSCTAERERI